MLLTYYITHTSMLRNKCLKLGLFNAGSLNTGHDELCVEVDCLQSIVARISAINETWLRPGQDARAPLIPGYNLRHIPRPLHLPKDGGGGVSFYIKKGLRVRTLTPPSSDIEQMWLTLSVNSFSFLIGTAYRPSWVKVDDFLDSLTETVTTLNKYDYVFLLGDFNINLLDVNDRLTLKLKYFLESLSLISHVTVLTHFTTHSSTLIDLICSSANAPVGNVTVNHILTLGGHSIVSVQTSR